jgi:hypothetical protein
MGKVAPVQRASVKLAMVTANARYLVLLMTMRHNFVEIFPYFSKKVTIFACVSIDFVVHCQWNVAGEYSPRERMVVMNVSAVTMTAPVIPQQVQAQAVSQSPTVEQDQQQSQNAINTSMQASVQVMDMAQSSFDDAASQLINSMAASMTGVGQNVDVSV